MTTSSKKAQLILNFCAVLESLCKKLSIRIEGKIESARSESVYYILYNQKKDKYCKIRVSHHENNKDKVYDFDLLISKENFEERIEEILSYFGFKKIKTGD
jgi:hypothetical protein